MASRESVERGRSGLAPANAAAAAALGVGATSRVPTAAATTPTLTATRAARARTAPHRASASAAAASPAPAATPTGVPAPRRSASGGVRTSRESIDRLSRPKSVHSAAPDYPYKGATLRRTTSAHSSGPPSPTPAAPRSAARGPQPSKSPTSALPASRRRAATATGRPSRLSLPGGPRAAADTDLRAAASLDVDRGEPSELTQELTTEQSFMSDITAPLDSIREQHSRASSLYDDLSLDGASALPSPRPSPTRSAHTTARPRFLQPCIARDRRRALVLLRVHLEVRLTDVHFGGPTAGEPRPRAHGLQKRHRLAGAPHPQRRHRHVQHAPPRRVARHARLRRAAPAAAQLCGRRGVAGERATARLQRRGFREHRQGRARRRGHRRGCVAAGGRRRHGRAGASRLQSCAEPLAAH